MDKKLKHILFFLLLVVTGIILRLLLLYPPGIHDGDAACFGIMSLDIYHLKEFPIYLRLAHYNGALVSYIGAILFSLFGVSSFVYNLSGIIFSCLWVVFSFLLARKILASSGILPLLLFVILPPVYILYLSIYPGGIYAETLFFGSLLLLLLVKYNNNEFKHRYTPYLLLGFFSAMGMWTSPHIFPLLLTIGSVFLIKERKLISPGNFLFIAAFSLGYLPAIIYNLQHPGATFFRMGGRILSLNAQVLSSPGFLGIIINRILWRLSTVPLSLLRAPFSLFLLIGAFNMALFIISAFWVYKNDFKDFLKSKVINNLSIFMLLSFWVIIFYALLVGEKSPRYVIMLCVIVPFFISRFLSDIKKKLTRTYLVAVVTMALCNMSSVSYILFNRLVNHYSFNIGAYSLLERRVHHYPQLTGWLFSKKLLYGYSDYWTGYPVVFESKEKILISNTMFHSHHGDRWPEVTKIVRATKNPAYIIDMVAYSGASGIMEERLKKLAIDYKKHIIYEFAVYYDFSREVYPEDLNFLAKGP